MATGAPIPVREYTSADEMRRHAAEVRARLFAPSRLPVVIESLEVAAVDAAAEPVQPPATKAWTKPKVEEQGLVTAQALASEFAYKPLPHPIRRMTRLVSNVTGITVTDLRSSSRTADKVKARQILFFVCRTYLNFSLPEIGRRTGGRDHTTILHAVRKVQAIVEGQNIKIGDSPIDLSEALWAAKWPKCSR